MPKWSLGRLAEDSGDVSGHQLWFFSWNTPLGKASSGHSQACCLPGHWICLWGRLQVAPKMQIRYSWNKSMLENCKIFRTYDWTMGISCSKLARNRSLWQGSRALLTGADYKRTQHSRVKFTRLTISVIHFLNKYIIFTFQNCFVLFPPPTNHHFLFSQWFLHCVWQQPCFHHLETQYSEQNLSSWLMCQSLHTFGNRICKIVLIKCLLSLLFRKTHPRWKVPLTEFSVGLCLQGPVSRKHTSRSEGN